MINKALIVIIGPTGVGKTDLSIEIAQKFKTEIISADSRQIYKELNIGTAVPDTNQLNLVKHHFVQYKSIHDYYNASMFEMEVLDTLTDLFQNKNCVVMTGGSMMYVDAVCFGIDDLPTVEMELRNQLILKFKTEGIEHLRQQLKILDPEYYRIVDLANPKRILKALEICLQTGKPYSSFRTNKPKIRPFEIIKIGLNRDREQLYQRINVRVDKMIENGLLEEAKKLYPYRNLNSLNTVGYKEIFDYLDGGHDFFKAVELIKRNSRHYAKKQLSWFGRDTSIKWFHPDDESTILQYINKSLI